MTRDELDEEDPLSGDAFVIDDLDPPEVETIVCSSCQREVYEDCAVCPYCHEILLAPTGYPTWVVWTAVGMVIVLTLVWALS